MAYADNVVSAESGGDPDARNARSSAAGAGQFIDGTWLDMIARHRPDLAEGRSRSEILALRSDKDLSKAMVDAYGADNVGHTTTAGAILGPAAVKANPFLAGMSAADVAAWADRKMGGAGRPASAAAPLSIAGPPPGQESADIVPATPKPAPRGAIQIGGASPAPVDLAALAQVPQPAPLLLPQRGRINLAQAYGRARSRG